MQPSTENSFWAEPWSSTKRGRSRNVEAGVADAVATVEAEVADGVVTAAAEAGAAAEVVEAMTATDRLCSLDS